MKVHEAIDLLGVKGFSYWTCELSKISTIGEWKALGRRMVDEEEVTQDDALNILKVLTKLQQEGL